MNILRKIKNIFNNSYYHINLGFYDILLRRTLNNIQINDIEDFILKNSKFVKIKFNDTIEKCDGCNFNFDPILASKLINIINKKSIKYEEYCSLYEYEISDEDIYKNTYNDIYKTLQIVELNKIELLEDIYFTIFYFTNKNEDKSYVATIISRGPVYKDFNEYEFFKSVEYTYNFWGE